MFFVRSLLTSSIWFFALSMVSSFASDKTMDKEQCRQWIKMVTEVPYREDILSNMLPGHFKFAPAEGLTLLELAEKTFAKKPYKYAKVKEFNTRVWNVGKDHCFDEFREKQDRLHMELQEAAKSNSRSEKNYLKVLKDLNKCRYPHDGEQVSDAIEKTTAETATIIAPVPLERETESMPTMTAPAQ